MKQVDSELIGLIYDAALEPRKWSELLFSLGNMAEEAKPSEDGKDGSILINSENASALQEHIHRAFKLSEQINNSQQAQGVTQNIADLLPIPALVVDDCLRVKSVNASFELISEKEHRLLRISEGKLISNSETLLFKLGKQINTLKQTTFDDFYTLRVQSSEPRKPMSLLIKKMDSVSHPSELFLILVASTPSKRHLSETMLTQFYDLTAAEQKLAIGIAGGESLTEIAKQNKVSIHTVRTQLKMVFSKVGVKRQSDLVRTLFTNSLLSLNQTKNVQNNVTKAEGEELSVTKIFRLKDGRELSYAEYGDPDGEPVITFHPTTGSRLQCHPNDALTRSHSVRIILVDRPGFGFSTPQDNRTFLSFADDIAELAVFLKLQCFSLLGYCGGGPYAFACAHKFGSRVKQLTIVSGVTPYDSIDLLLGASTINRLLVKIATILPDSVFHLASILAKRIINEPELYLDELQGDLCSSDRDALNEPEFLNNFMVALADSLRQGPGELAREQLLFSNHWGFDHTSIKVPTDLWYGDMDRHVPTTLSDQLASDLPAAQFHKIENYGHFMIYHKWDEILETHIAGLNHNQERALPQQN